MESLARLRQTQGMGNPTNLQALRKRLGVGQRIVAERLEVSIAQISRWESGANNIPSGRLGAVAEAYGADVGDIMVGVDGVMALGPTLHVQGEVAAGIWREALEWNRPEWLSFTGRADIVAPLEKRFGLRVHGDSMNLLYPHGSIVECLSIESGGTVTSGKRVIVVRENEGGEIEATVKEYVERDGVEYLWPRSSHPDFQQPWRLDQGQDQIVRMSIIAVVVASIRPE